MEQVDLTTPKPSVTSYRGAVLYLDWQNAHIQIGLLGPLGEQASFTYDGEEATNLMIALNTANLTTNSLHKRALNKLIADGKLAGTISGTP